MRAVRVSLGVLAIGFPLLGTPPPACAALAPVVERYSSALASVKAPLSPSARENMAERLLLLSSYYQIDPRLLLAIVTVESSWHAGAVSSAGALGYGQLMPATAAHLQVQALEPYENLDGTARYLRRMMMHFAAADPTTRVQLAVASYNAGPQAVDRYGGVPPYAQTRLYVHRVLAQLQHFSTILDAPSTAAITSLVARSADTPRAAHPHPRQLARAHAVPAAAVPPSSQIALTVVRPRAFSGAARTMIDAAATHTKAITLAQDPTSVRYEPSHSFVARLFGIRHRVVDPAPALITAPTVW
ncbi:MAG: lytic transglycosylase domain-containing protein [Vulcanimicrobiaceae bacterium]